MGLQVDGVGNLYYAKSARHARKLSFLTTDTSSGLTLKKTDIVHRFRRPFLELTALDRTDQRVIGIRRTGSITFRKAGSTET